MTNRITFTIKRSRRAKRIRLVVHRDGRVAVSCPHGADMALIRQFVLAKRQWIWRKLQAFKNSKGNLLSQLTPQDYRTNKERARQLVEERIAFFNQMLGLTFNRLSIRNQKSRWGSCSSKKNININYKIIFLTPRQQDYIIVHELCHLQHMNHSPKFWALVEQLIPEYRTLRKELRHH